MMDALTFGQPLWFWGFALLPLLLALFARNERRRGKLLRQLVAARLQDRLAGTVSVGRRRLRFALLLLALASLIASLAQPRLGHTWEQSKRQGRDVIIAIDCSRSMLATDLAPSRLGRAKLAAQDFIGQLQGDRIGLIAFAGSAFLQAPLTIDYGAVLTSMAELDTTIIPRGGTNIAAAVKEAVEAFGKGESDNRCLLIFTDGEELDADGLAAATAQNGKLKIFTVGLGSPDGSLIPIPGENGGTAFVTDDRGETVKSRLDEDRLRKIAEATGGFYVRLQNGPAEMQQIVRDGLSQMKEQEIDARLSRRPIERYQWPLSAALVLLVSSSLISERRRRAPRAVALARALAICALALSAGVLRSEALTINPGVKDYAAGVDFLNRGQTLKKEENVAGANEANEAATKRFEAAYQEFGKQLQRQPASPAMNFNQGVAAYRLGKDDEALDLFSKALLADEKEIQRDAEGYLGNTLYRSGEKRPGKAEKLRDWKSSVAHYDAALKLAPDHERIRAYRDYVQRKIDELEKEPPKSEEEQKKEKKEEEKKDGEKKDGEKKDGEKKDGEEEQQKDPQDSKDGKGEGQPDDKKQEPHKGSSSKDEQKEQPGDAPQDSKQDGKKDQEEPGAGDKKEEKEAKNDPAKDGQEPGTKPEQKPGEAPAPAPEQDKKRSGEIQGQGTPPPPADPQQEAAAEEQAAAEGKMTEAQARTLLDSLKGEDDRVLLKPAERRTGRAFRDW